MSSSSIQSVEAAKEKVLMDLSRMRERLRLGPPRHPHAHAMITLNDRTTSLHHKRKILQNNALPVKKRKRSSDIMMEFLEKVHNDSQTA